MEHRKQGLFGPLFLITLGILFLLANLGMLPMTFWEVGLRFWPVILILAGLDIIFGRRSALGRLVVVALWILVIGGVIYMAMSGASLMPMGTTTTDNYSQPLGDIKTASISISMGATNLAISSLGSDANNLLEASFQHVEGTRITENYAVTNGEGRLALKEEGVNVVMGSNSISKWNVKLNPSVPTALRINGGLASASLDLSDLNLPSLTVDTGIGSLDMNTPKAGASVMKLKGGMGSATIKIPEGVVARIRTSGGLGSINVNTSRFPKVGDVYQSADYATGANKIDIEIDGGMGSITIR